jgi:hypothetical protein
MKLPVWFERTENLAIAAAVVTAFVSLHFSWWWLPALFLAFDASMAGYLAGNRAGAVCYNLAHAYVVPAVLLLSYVASGTRWCAFVGLLWAFHIAGDRVLGYGLKFASGFQDTHLGTIGKQRLPRGHVTEKCQDRNRRWPKHHPKPRAKPSRRRARAGCPSAIMEACTTTRTSTGSPGRCTSQRGRARLTARPRSTWLPHGWRNAPKIQTPRHWPR